MSRFVGILKSAPAAHILNKNRLELYRTADDIVQQCAKPVSMFNDDTAFSRVFVCLYDDEAMLVGVLLDAEALIGHRILLIFRGHAEILRRWNRHAFLLHSISN